MVQIINAIGIQSGEELPVPGQDCVPGIVLGVFPSFHLRRGSTVSVEEEEHRVWGWTGRV